MGPPYTGRRPSYAGSHDEVRAPSNQSSLRALFEDIGLAADTIDHILNKEPDMTSIRNFVMCAETAEDAETAATAEDGATATA